jgi:bifunctional UDP-N-acetylglucosamine pyrophosphorylase/glucosamine-1-phosphate N-acetyltransferase
MRAGVRVADPDNTWVDVSVGLAAGAYIGPGTQLEGSTTVAAEASVGPGCLLRDTVVGKGATVIQSVCESAVIGAGARVGPFAHLMPGARVEDGEQVTPPAPGTAAANAAGESAP